MQAAETIKPCSVPGNSRDPAKRTKSQRVCMCVLVCLFWFNVSQVCMFRRMEHVWKMSSNKHTSTHITQILMRFLRPGLDPQGLHPHCHQKWPECGATRHRSASVVKIEAGPEVTMTTTIMEDSDGGVSQEGENEVLGLPWRVFS